MTSVQTTITIKEIRNMNCNTFSKKDDSPRGIETVFKNELLPGDEIVLHNHFVLITD